MSVRQPYPTSSSGLKIGSAVSGGGANCVLFEDASQNLATDGAFLYTTATHLLRSAGSSEFSEVIVDLGLDNSTGTVNNYALGVNSGVSFQGSSSLTLTGIARGSLFSGAGKMCYLIWTGTGTLTLNNQDTNSTSTNRIITGTGAPLVLATGQGCILHYNTNIFDNRWHVMATSPLIASVSNSDGTLTISPTTGAVVASIANDVALPGNPTTTTQATTDNSTRIATTAYVTTGINNAIAGVNPAVAVQAATVAASDTSGFTYSNGVSGIGATFTGSVNTAVTIDGYTFTALGQRLLVKNDTQSPSGAFNGVYYVTQVQTAILAPILTRALDYNQPSDINNTGAIPVINGTVNASTSWIITSSVTTVGTDPLTYTQFSFRPGFYPYTGISATYAILTTDYFIDATSGTFVATLPTAVGVTGKTYIIKNSGTGTVTLATTSAQTIDGFASSALVLRNTYQYVQVTSDGSNWKITGGDVSS